MFLACLHFPHNICHRIGSTQEMVINHALSYLNAWEHHATAGVFLSKSTAEWLQVTLQSTKELLEFLARRANFHYLMTSSLSLDCLERLFGIAQQSSGKNDNPTLVQFCVIMRRMLRFLQPCKKPKKIKCCTRTSAIAPRTQQAVSSQTGMDVWRTWQADWQWFRGCCVSHHGQPTLHHWVQWWPSCLLHSRLCRN